MNFVQIKYTYPCLQAFTMTEHWLKQPKALPCLIVVECQTIGRFTNHHKTPANKTSLTGVGMNLVQIKYTYPCLQAFTMTEHWLKQPKALPYLIVVEHQTIGRCTNHHKTPTNKPPLTGVILNLLQVEYGPLL